MVLAACAGGNVKDKNIVESLNRVLSEHFKVPCKFEGFGAYVEFDTVSEHILQGTYGSNLTFFAESSAPAGWSSDGTVVTGVSAVTVMSQTISYHCTAELLFASDLRKKILKAMLKHNGE